MGGAAHRALPGSHSYNDQHSDSYRARKHFYAKPNIGAVCHAQPASNDRSDAGRPKSAAIDFTDHRVRHFILPAIVRRALSRMKQTGGEINKCGANSAALV